MLLQPRNNSQSRGERARIAQQDAAPRLGVGGLSVIITLNIQTP